MSPTPTIAPEADVPLAPFTTLGVGGDAHRFLSATSADEVAAALAWAAARELPVLVLGGGSNLVVADAGWPGLVLQPALRGIAFESEGERVRVTAAAGEPWDALVAATVARGLAGLECLSGIPGAVGGTPVQNVGAYGQEVAETIGSVTVIERGSGERLTLANAECGFGYRQSRFKRDDAGRFVVTAVSFLLTPGGVPRLAYPDLKAAFAADEAIGRTPSLTAVRDAVLAVRKRKGMVLDAADNDTRSCGSFFMNPVVPAAQHAALEQVLGLAIPAYPADAGRVKVPAAWLIEQAGFAKGTARGRVGLSTKHPLALINRGGATAAEVVAFAREVQETVAERYGVVLRAEPEFVGFGADAEVALLRGSA